MELMHQLSQFASQPIPHHVLINLLKEYKRPNDKIHELLTKNILLRVKKGLYVTGKIIGNHPVPKQLLANQLYGPSYVSLDYALSHYGIIPEGVTQLTSVSIKPSKIILNSIATFNYKHIPMPYYSYGIVEGHQASSVFLLASPEKAVCDKIVCANGIHLRSLKETMALIFDNWRMDEHVLKQLNLKQINSWFTNAPKKESLQWLIKAIKQC